MLASPACDRRILLALTPDHRKQLSKLLLRPHSPLNMRFHVTWCDNATSARAQIKKQHFDVMLISEDLETDDPQFLSSLQLNPGAPAIVYLSNGQPLAADELLEKGVQEIVAVDALNPTSFNVTISTALSRENALRRQLSRAQNDSLTGLVNREHLAERIQVAIDNANENRRNFVVLRLNLDSFYTLTGNYGLKTGDQLILRTKDRIQSIIGSKATLARTGTDEFAILIENLHNPLEITRIANKLLDVVTMPIIVGTESAQVTSSIGIAFYPQAGTDAHTILQNATIALEAAKREPDNSFKRFNKEMELQVRGNFMLDKQLRQALPKDELELYYQPRIDLKTGEIVGAEALIRWNHPEKGLLSPGEFMPMAEESNLIIPLGYWILERACQDWQALQEWGFENIHLAINLSFKQFHDDELAETITSIVEKYPINPNYLEFELTETTIMHDHQRVCRALEKIGQSGISFSLDDFGTGYSSLAHIISLPINMLKIDRSFVDGMEQGGEHAVIVQSIIALAHSLKFKVVSEGVELTEQCQQLIELDCDQCQGYYFSKPLPFDKFCEYLAESSQ